MEIAETLSKPFLAHAQQDAGHLGLKERPVYRSTLCACSPLDAEGSLMLRGAGSEPVNLVLVAIPLVEIAT
jgi:hypothetical protein